jgi:hypothetical protein
MMIQSEKLAIKIQDAQNWTAMDSHGQAFLYAKDGIILDDHGIEAPITGCPSKEIRDFAACFPGEHFSQELENLAIAIEAEGY